MSIRINSFFHSWYYHYRLHEDHLTESPSFCHPVGDFLHSLFEQCPDEYFRSGVRSSHIKKKLPLTPHEIKHHMLIRRAREGKQSQRFKTAHSNVNVHILETETTALAVEVPLWFTPDEMKSYELFFGSAEPLTGHIDLLSFDDQYVWIWDYKPNACKEKYASMQLYLYAQMLSRRTEIPLTMIRCGYFDDQTCLVFDPASIPLSEITEI